jgi:hypothetical protein
MCAGRVHCPFVGATCLLPACQKCGFCSRCACDICCRRRWRCHPQWPPPLCRSVRCSTSELPVRRCRRRSLTVCSPGRSCFYLTPVSALTGTGCVCRKWGGVGVCSCSNPSTTRSLLLSTPHSPHTHSLMRACVCFLCVFTPGVTSPKWNPLRADVSIFTVRSSHPPPPPLYSSSWSLSSPPPPLPADFRSQEHAGREGMHHRLHHVSLSPHAPIPAPPPACCSPVVTSFLRPPDRWNWKNLRCTISEC